MHRPIWRFAKAAMFKPEKTLWLCAKWKRTLRLYIREAATWTAIAAPCQPVALPTMKT
jgi:hypothetical protein